MMRPYKADDQEVLVELLRQNTPKYFAPEEEADLIHYLNHPKGHHYVYTKDDQVLGCAGYEWRNEHTLGWVSWFLVDTQQQGQGIGGALLEFCLQQLKEAPALEKVIVRTSQLAYGFFERSGFVLTKTEKDYWAPGYDLYVMELVTDS